MTCSPETIERLASASVATVERNPRELRRVLVGRRMSQTKPGGLLRREIPVVVGRWRSLDTPGYLEIDLVSHSGEAAAGEWIWTLRATDLSTGWAERIAVMGKGQARIVASPPCRQASPPSCARPASNSRAPVGPAALTRSGAALRTVAWLTQG